MRSRMAAVLLLLLPALLAIGMACAGTGDGPSVKTSVPEETLSRQLMPLGFDEDSQPPPPGFSSWAAYVEFTTSLLYADDGSSPPANLTKPAQVTINPDGTLTIVPGIVTQPDGSTGQWLGQLPSGSSVRFHDDGSVTVSPPSHLPENP